MAKEFLLLKNEKVVLKHQCTIRFQGILLLTNKRVLFSKDGLGKSFLNTGGSLILTAVSGVASKEIILPLENIQAVGKVGNMGGFQILTKDNQTISGAFVTSNVFQIGGLKKVCDEFVTYVSQAISENEELKV